jgi:putative PIN family toxin of toxin-antitoxin system
MRVVLDTNVLVSGLLSAAGPPGWIIEAVLAGHLEPALDMRIRTEYEAVLQRPEFRFPRGAVGEVLSALDRFAFHVAAAPPWPMALPDPDDEPFLSVSAAAGAILITGNLRHFPARARGEVRVLSPREFATLWRTA